MPSQLVKRTAPKTVPLATGALPRLRWNCISDESDKMLLVLNRLTGPVNVAAALTSRWSLLLLPNTA